MAAYPHVQCQPFRHNGSEFEPENGATVDVREHDDLVMSRAARRDTHAGLQQPKDTLASPAPGRQLFLHPGGAPLAGTWVDRRVLSQSAVDWQRHAVERLFGDDPALGSKAFRRELQDCLRATLTIASDSRRKLRHLIDLGRPGYPENSAGGAAIHTPKSWCHW
ncbi:hypothetical protein [Nonomuraea sp. NPDC048901]|uniref:hypothetical protein n=1 Tax=Nonomuraea sp. NPDC048901 TaxID=3155627 RepID=UPI00340137C3